MTQVSARHKVFVSVNADFDVEGNLRPRFICWEGGRRYQIDRLKDRRRAASTKVGGCGIRYTVLIMGQETYLFFEDGRWFVEAKERQ